MAESLPNYVELGGVFALCGGLITLVRYMLSDHRRERETQESEHRTERREWRDHADRQIERLSAADDKRTDRIEKAFEHLTEAIRRDQPRD